MVLQSILMIKYLLRLKWKKKTEVHFEGCIYVPQPAKQKGKLNVWLILHRMLVKPRMYVEQN